MDMVNGYSNGEQDSLVEELTKGMELTKQLKSQMGLEISGESKDMLLERIVSSYENALLLLNYGGSIEKSQHHVVPPANVPWSPIPVIGSPKSEDLNPAEKDTADFSRKRKMIPTWTEQVKGNSENEVEGPPNDGYSWRKYGQKDILGAKHPRSYYRCTYRSLRGCSAAKQVQRNDENPSLFDLTYKGKHTCTIIPCSKSAPTSPQKQDRNKNQITNHKPDVLLNFQRGLSVETHNLESQETGFPIGSENDTFTPSVPNHNSFFGHFPSAFMPSSSNSASNYFSTSACNLTYGVQYGQYCESEIISAVSSGTNSPIIGMDYQLEQLELNPTYHYGNQVFFPSIYQPKE